MAHTVELQPARVRHVYQPAVHQWVEQPVVVKPATTHVVNHPPVVATVHERVKVQDGRTTWQPVRH